MPFTAEYLQASFGSTRTGIATVGYTLKKDDGTDSVARTTTGVVEEGGGVYGVANVNIPDDAYSVLWDTGGGSPVYAAEDLEPMRLREAIDLVTQTNLDVAVSTRGLADPGDEMALVDDAITSAKHDEATSFPLSSVDSGSTEVARTGADGDTLKSLSDQIDPVALEANVEGHVTDGLTTQGYTTARAPMIELAKKMLINRLELVDGSSNNWILYDDDDTTPLLTFSVTSKTGGNIDQPSVAPSRRTRGT